MCITVPGVPPHNNPAEQVTRYGVIGRKTSHGTDSETGSRYVERMLTLAETCRQGGRSVVAYLTACLEANRIGRPMSSPLA